MTQHDVVQALVALGYSLNEGRAYSALLKSGPCTGYEVSQRANVPRSAVYGALRRLVASGAARSLAGSPERFVAAPADGVVDLLRQRFEASTDRLMTAIRSLDVEDASPDAFSVHGYARVLEEGSRLIRSAERKVVMSGWPREFLELADALEEAAGKPKVRVYVFSHASPPDELPGVQFSYGLQEAALEAFWKHRLVLVIDDTMTLIGSTETSPSDNAVISQTPAIAELATSQIGLDITLLAQRYHHDLGGVLSEILGDRIGDLDPLLQDGPGPLLGRHVRPKRRRAKPKAEGSASPRPLNEGAAPTRRGSEGALHRPPMATEPKARDRATPTVRSKADGSVDPSVAAVARRAQDGSGELRSRGREPEEPPPEGGEPPSNEGSEPPSHESGEPPSNESGEPPSDESSEPPSNESSEPPSHGSGEPPSHEGGEPPSLSGEPPSHEGGEPPSLSGEPPSHESGEPPSQDRPADIRAADHRAADHRAADHRTADGAVAPPSGPVPLKPVS